MQQFKFQLGQRAVIVCSGEKGQIIGRIEYAENPPSYLLRYVTNDGRAQEAWWTGEALDALEVAEGTTVEPPDHFSEMLRWAAEDLADPAIRADANRLALEHEAVAKRLTPYIEEIVQLASRQLRADQTSSASSK